MLHTLVLGVFLGALISLVLFIPALRKRIQKSLRAKILAALLSGSLAAGVLYRVLVVLAKVAISLTLASNLTTAHEFLGNQEILDSTTDDVFLCELAPSKYEDACGHTASYRWLFGDSASEFVGTIRNPALYLTTYVGSIEVVVVVDFLGRRKAPP